MVTGGSIANVGSQIFAKRSGKSLIDYDIALLSEPCMLLGVSCGVICNLMFPEWLITMIFAVFLAFCTFKTCKSGVSFWKLESEGGRINGCLKMENEEAGESTKMPLLSVDEGKFEIPLMKLGMLVTAATCSFMVLFSSTMSAVQYLFLGMENMNGAVIYAAVCFTASLVGLTLVQRAIIKHGRASLIVFSVGTVMALSTVLITSFGAVNVWKDYNSGESMGFKTPC
ncbi:hypothetical protein ACS0TY_018167 [Phlomoides rotata]